MFGVFTNVAIWGDLWHYGSYYKGAFKMNVTIGNRTIILTDVQIMLYEELTKLQQGVALNTLRGMKPAEAHRNAGGKCKNESQRSNLCGQILKDPSVSVFMDHMKQDPSPDIADAVMTRDKMLQDLTVIADSSIYDVATFLDVDDELMNMETGELFKGQSIINVKSMNDIKPQHRCLIKSIKQTKHGIELTLYSAMDARKMISDMCGYNAPVKRELSGPDGGPIKIAEMNDDDLSDELTKLGLDIDGL